MRLVCFDLETGGLDPSIHPIIQIAAIAVDENLIAIREFEAKIAFDRSKADSETLKLNSFDEDVWQKEQRPLADVCGAFSEFLRNFSDVRMMSQKTGRPYSVAQLIGHNAATFDGPFLQSAYRSTGTFLPASYKVLCTMQRAMFFFLERGGEQPKDFKLGTLCEFFGVKIDGAHDALNDVRATVELYRTILDHRDRNRQ